MPRAQNRAAKGSILKEDEILCQSGYMIYLWLLPSVGNFMKGRVLCWWCQFRAECQFLTMVADKYGVSHILRVQWHGETCFAVSVCQLYSKYLIRSDISDTARSQTRWFHGHRGVWFDSRGQVLRYQCHNVVRFFGGIKVTVGSDSAVSVTPHTRSHNHGISDTGESDLAVYSIVSVWMKYRFSYVYSDKNSLAIIYMCFKMHCLKYVENLI